MFLNIKTLCSPCYIAFLLILTLIKMELQLPAFNTIFQLFATFYFAYISLSSIRDSITAFHIEQITKEYQKILKILNAFKLDLNYQQYLNIIDEECKKYEERLIEENSKSEEVLKEKQHYIKDKYVYLFFFFGTFAFFLLYLSSIAIIFDRVIFCEYIYSLLISTIVIIVGVTMKYWKDREHFGFIFTSIIFLVNLIVSIVICLFLEYFRNKYNIHNTGYCNTIEFIGYNLLLLLLGFPLIVFFWKPCFDVVRAKKYCKNTPKRIKKMYRQKQKDGEEHIDYLTKEMGKQFNTPNVEN